VKIILYTVAYTMASSATGFENEATQLLEKTDIIASTPHTLENLVDPFYTGAGDEPSDTQSALGLFQKHLQEEAKQAWELSCLPRPWKSIVGSDEEDPLASAQKHAFPALNVPETLAIGPRPVYPDVHFSVYADQDIETVPPASDITAFLVRDTLTDSINALDFNRNATAKFLIEVDCYFAPNTFVRRATPFDKLRDLAGDRPTWKPEDVAVDAAFSQLFQLPAPEHKLVYYHSVLTEACKIAPAAIAPSLGRAIRFLYRSVDRLDLELAHRFLDWFAHHLSNFGFTWKWTEW
jgi:nuclear cap-binding protein subunit 1